MSNTKLKECPQKLWLGNSGYSHEGICYYMSEYVEKTLWGDVKTFDQAVDAAKKAVPDTIIKAGKAKNLKDRAGLANPQQNGYASINGGLAEKTMYRIELWFGSRNENPTAGDDVNHEAICITGTGREVLYFEPNFGFYHANHGTWNNQRVLEQYIDSLYQTEDWATNFHYRRIRKLG